MVGGRGVMFFTALFCVFCSEFPWSSKAPQPWTLFLCCAHIPLAQAWNGMLGMSPPSKIFLDQAYPFSLKNLCCTAFALLTFIFLCIFGCRPNYENSRAPFYYLKALLTPWHQKNSHRKRTNLSLLIGVQTIFLFYLPIGSFAKWSWA